MTTQLTVGDIFAGFGGWSIGARAAGHRLLWAVEHDPAIAQTYAVNLGSHVIVSGAQDVDIHRLEPPDILLASPPCQSHSQARSKKLATRDDAEIGGCVLDYIRILRPQFVFIENVEGWKRSKSFQRIFNGLNELGYWTNVMVLNTADFGVPQTRKRLILRASCAGFLPPLPAPTKWRGWYDAIVDLIPDLPESKFADWQLARLPKYLRDSAIFNNQQSDDRRGGTYGVSYRLSSEPSLGVTNSFTPNAFIIRDDNSKQEWGKQVRLASEPAYTQSQSSGGRAFLVGGGNTQKAQVDSHAREGTAPALTTTANEVRSRAWLSQGRVVKMTPRALARFQSIPDETILPESAALACKCIGNAVPPLFGQKLLEGLN